MRYLVLAFLVVGCARPLVERPWVRVTTAHLTVETDLPRETAVDRAGAFEDAWSLLDRAYRVFGVPRATPSRIQVVVPSDCGDLPRRVSKFAGGWVNRSRDFEGTRVAVVCGEPAWGFEIFRHELAHVFNAAFFGGLPTWLNEGLATYFQQIRIEGQVALLGTPPRMDVKTIWSRGLSTVDPDLSEIRPLTREQWNAREGRATYRTAWRAVYTLANTIDEDRGHLRAFLAALAAGSDEPTAWRDHIAAVEPALRRAMDGIGESDRLAYWTIPYAAAPRGSLQVEPLARREVAALMLALSRDAPAASAFAAELERELASWPQAHFWLAMWLVYRDKPDHEAVLRHLRAYVAAVPDDARGRLALVGTELKKRVPSGHLGTEPEPPAGLEALEGDVAQLARRARTAAELEMVGRYWMLRRRPAIAATFLERALVQDLGCTLCLHAQALVSFQLGRIDDAIGFERRAISSLAEATVTDELRRCLAVFENARPAR